MTTTPTRPTFHEWAQHEVDCGRAPPASGVGGYVAVASLYLFVLYIPLIAVGMAFCQFVLGVPNSAIRAGAVDGPVLVWWPATVWAGIVLWGVIFDVGVTMRLRRQYRERFGVGQR